MNNYGYDKQLKIRAKPFYVKCLLPFANAVISVLPKGLNKNKVSYEKYRVGQWRFHIIKPIVKPAEKTDEKNLPCLFYLHGGGFGYKESFVQYRCAQEYALGANCAVIGVDYPLLLKNVYPAAIEYCKAVYEYVFAHSSELKIDKTRLALGGDSAGGSLATELAFLLNEQDALYLAALMLIYPVVDGENRKSMREYKKVPLWNASCNAKMWKWYLNGAEYLSPINRPNKPQIKNLFVETEQFDCLHDEGIALYNSLFSNCENAELLDNKGTFHGYDINFKADIVKQSLKKRIGFLNKAFNS